MLFSIDADRLDWGTFSTSNMVDANIDCMGTVSTDNVGDGDGMDASSRGTVRSFCIGFMGVV